MDHLTPIAQIVTRLNDRERLRYFKRKVHDLRKVVAGDWSRFGDSAPGNNPDASGNAKERNDGLYDILVMEVGEGKSNLMLQAVRTLAMQCTVQFPDVSFPDVSTEEASINQLYLNARLGPKPRGCDAMHDMRLALFDYMISGVGWVWAGTRNSIPVVQCVDTLDCFWDCDAKLLKDIRWVAASFRRPIADWIAEFGPSRFEDLDDPDKIVEVLYYFDVDGETGTYAAFLYDGENLDDEPLEVGENPHYYDCDGFRQPFLPIEPIYHLALPSVKFPMSLVEGMLAPALAYRQAEDYINQITKAGKPFYEVEENSLSDDEKRNLEEGEYGAIVTRRSGSAPITVRPGMEIPSVLMEWLELNKNEIVANSGANPYASGSKVEGVTYAAEVNAIQQQAGLMAATIARDHASHWGRVISKVLANAVAYDDRPLKLTWQNVPMTFGPEDPILGYLRADATPAVSEDSMRFESREQRVMRTQQMLTVVAQPFILQQFSNALPQALQEYLQASGVKDVMEWMKAPTPAPALPPAGAPQQALGASNGLPVTP